MAEAITRPTTATAAALIARVPDPVRRADAEALVRIFQRATGEPPVMWGGSIVGFGSYHYEYESGRKGDYEATENLTGRAAAGLHPGQRKATHVQVLTRKCKWRSLVQVEARAR